MQKKRKIAAMVNSLCSEWSDRIGIFIEEIGNLDREDDKDSRSNSHRTKHRRAARVPGIRMEETEHHGGIPDDNEKLCQPQSQGKMDKKGATEKALMILSPQGPELQSKTNLDLKLCPRGTVEM